MKKTSARVAMIGYQFMGRAHANAWRQAKHFAKPALTPELRVVCGRDAKAAEIAAETLGFAESDTSWQRVIQRDDIDIVDICTPGDSHAEIAIAAAAAGKAILCEKPLTNTVTEALAMEQAAEAAGIVHMLCHNYRRVPAVALAKRLLEEGRLGRIFHFRGTYLQDWIIDPEFPLVWRLQKTRAGSGALGDIGSHSLDLARHLVGEILEVSGHLTTFVDQRPLEDGSGTGAVDVDDAALSLLRFENGAIGTMEASRFAAGRKNANRFEINGEKGSLSFDLERLNELEFYEEAGSESGFRTILATDESHPFVEGWWPPGHLLGYEHSFTNTILDFLAAVATGSSPSPNFSDGRQNLQVLEAIERSSNSRHWEHVIAA
ncbi:MAG: Gfo/Idh/MocA family oxidoreductase [Candidatus Binatia bacterium]|nr:Gfo/Idh/MocA family oxidoreductase [Candidatus Binatia bacterium]MDG2011026.1 Gfo/Idh/MocA family oxidoreductase [Candidatus Binatia bacterium]